MNKTIGIIGLGRTGMPAAKAYLSAGYKVFGCDKNPEVVKEFESMGGTHFSHPAEVADKTRAILIMVLNDNQVDEVMTGENGILQKAEPGTTIICMSTINRQNLVSVAEACIENGANFVDCPFTGGPARISDGSLTLIAAGPSKLISDITPVLEVIGNIVHVGEEPGLGQATKHCNQLLVGTTHAAVMEVITMARKLGLDPSLTCEVISSGIAGSDYFRLLSESVLEKKPSPGGLGQMCKDMSIVSNTTREIKMPAYVATGAALYFLTAELRGMQDREGAELIKVVEESLNNGENNEKGADG